MSCSGNYLEIYKWLYKDRKYNISSTSNYKQLTDQSGHKRVVSFKKFLITVI